MYSGLRILQEVVVFLSWKEAMLERRLTSWWGSRWDLCSFWHRFSGSYPVEPHLAGMDVSSLLVLDVILTKVVVGKR